jgi:hypothetical protein
MRRRRGKREPLVSKHAKGRRATPPEAQPDHALLGLRNLKMHVSRPTLTDEQKKALHRTQHHSVDLIANAKGSQAMARQRREEADREKLRREREDAGRASDRPLPAGAGQAPRPAIDTITVERGAPPVRPDAAAGQGGPEETPPTPHRPMISHIAVFQPGLIPQYLVELDALRLDYTLTIEKAHAKRWPTKAAAEFDVAALIDYDPKDFAVEALDEEVVIDEVDGQNVVRRREVQ